MLLAREAVNLDRSPQTEGTLLATLQRNPAVIGTFALPVDLASQPGRQPGRPHARGRAAIFGSIQSTRSTDASLGEIRFYDPRTQRAATSTAC